MFKSCKYLTLLLLIFIPAVSQAERNDDIKQLDQELQATKARLNEMAKVVADLSKELNSSKRVIKTWRYIHDPDKAMVGIVMTDNDKNSGNGVIIKALTPGGPAEQAGLKSGDVITGINGTKISDSDNALRQAYDLLDNLKQGDQIKLSYTRDKKKKNIALTAKRMQPKTFNFDDKDFEFSFDLEGLDTLDKELEVIGKHMQDLDFPHGIKAPHHVRHFMHRFGPLRDLDLTSLNKDLGEYFGIDEGILITRVDSKLSEDLKAGDVITQVDNTKVTQPKELIRHIKKHNESKSFTFSILRQKKPIKVTIQLPKYHGPHEVSRR